MTKSDSIPLSPLTTQQMIQGTFFSIFNKCEDQDEHLDILEATLSRQQHIGSLIHQELDHHIGLLTDIENRTEENQISIRSTSAHVQSLGDEFRQSLGNSLQFKHCSILGYYFCFISTFIGFDSHQTLIRV